MAGKANLSTSPQQWRQFVAMAKAKKLPTGMQAQYQTSRMDLFNLLLTSDMDTTVCEAKVQRNMTTRAASGRGWVYATITAMKGDPWFYTDEDIQHIVEVQTAKGRFIEDELFSDKPEKTAVPRQAESWFQVRRHPRGVNHRIRNRPMRQRHAAGVGWARRAHAFRRVPGRPGALCV